MNKPLHLLRLIASLPIYAVSGLLWIYIAITVFRSAGLVFATHLSPYEFGQVLWSWCVCIIAGCLGAGLWLLARYVRSASFKKAAKPAAAAAPIRGDKV